MVLLPTEVALSFRRTKRLHGIQDFFEVTDMNSYVKYAKNTKHIQNSTTSLFLQVPKSDISPFFNLFFQN
jgi:hypothetical protein